MSNLHIVALEPLDTRYTKQWAEWFQEEFPHARIIHGATFAQSRTDSKSFLNWSKTNIYKADQIRHIAEAFDLGVIKDGDGFLFLDAWHYGSIAVRYMSQLMGIKVKLFGMWHAGSYDPADLVSTTGGYKYFKNVERGYKDCYDLNFFATQFHADLFCDQLEVSGHNIRVTGFPYKFDHLDTYKNMPKLRQVVFPHRLSSEKQPSVMRDLEEMLERRGVSVVFCQEKKLSKHEYHMVLGQSKIVFSANLQETWGIGTFEAMYVGALPLVPDRLSYREMYDLPFKYRGDYFLEGHCRDAAYFQQLEQVEKYICDMIDNYDQYRVTALRNLTNLQGKFCTFRSIKEQLAEHGFQS